MSRVVFVLVPQLHLLDLAGPAQVFATARDQGCEYELCYVADEPNVTSAQGLALTATPDWVPTGPGDLVVVPGWEWRRNRVISPRVAQRLRKHSATGATVASVCSGAFALGAAGVLAGRRCTTHHSLQSDLQRQCPEAHVVKDVLFVTDGPVVTSAGIASGIDLALHLVAMRDGPALAARVAREMVVYARRNGSDPQASAMLRHRSHLSDVVHRAQDLIDGQFAERITLARLSSHAGVSERTMTRLFTDATGLTPLQYQQNLRVERAEHLIGHGSMVESAARAVGFTDARMLRRLRARRAMLR